jgi:hypothetical protein
MARSSRVAAAVLAAVMVASLGLGGGAAAAQPHAEVWHAGLSQTTAVVLRDGHVVMEPVPVAFADRLAAGLPGVVPSSAAEMAGTGAGVIRTSSVAAKYGTVRGATYVVTYRAGYTPTPQEMRKAMARGGYCTTPPVWDAGVGVVCWRVVREYDTLRLLRASTTWPYAPDVVYTQRVALLTPPPTVPVVSPLHDYIAWTGGGALHVMPWAAGISAGTAVGMDFGLPAVSAGWRIVARRLPDGRLVDVEAACAYTRGGETGRGYRAGGLHCVDPATGWPLGWG